MLSISKLRTICCELYTKIQKNESNSQQLGWHYVNGECCELYTKIQ